MKQIIKYVTLLMALVLFSSLLFFSCTKEDAFKKYTKDGERIYTGKLDSVKIYSGKGRVRLTGMLDADPKISLLKVFWNGDNDSATFDIDKNSSNYPAFDKTIAVDEGIKSFKIRTYDQQNNSSIGVFATGVSYGENYRKRLLNRPIISWTFTGGNIVINWDQVDNTLGPISTEVTYIQNGEAKTVTTPVDAAQTVIKDLVSTTVDIRYRTIFKPDLTAIDTFATPYTQTRMTGTLYEVLINRSKYAAYMLPGDAPLLHGTEIIRMWDNKLKWPWVAFAESSTGPSLMTIDLGQSAKLSRIWWLPQPDGTRYYLDRCMKRFEIYGSAAPNPNGELDASWKLLGSYEVVKPSGLPYGTENAADLAAASAGFSFDVDKSAPKIRYVRFKCFENFFGTSGIAIDEFKAYGDDR